MKRPILGGPRKSAVSADSGTAPGADSSSSSTLSPHLSFEGSLKYSGTLTINCSYRGSITTEDRLIVGSSGDVEAEITAGTVEIAGKVKGDVKARTSVRILTGGQVQGDIETPTIAMEEGVAFEGRCTRPVEPQSSRPASPPREKPDSESEKREKEVVESRFDS